MGDGWIMDERYLVFNLPKSFFFFLQAEEGDDGEPHTLWQSGAVAPASRFDQHDIYIATL